MIFVNKKQVVLTDLPKVLGVSIPLDKILKKPLFEINPELIYKDPANGPLARKSRQGMEFPAVFNVRKANGEVVEIRYATNATPDKTTEGRTDRYSPKKVVFDGKAVFLADDLDKAVFYFLHFYNKQSPFRAPGQQYFDKPFEFEFQNDELKANAQIAILQKRSEAMNHASRMDAEEMVIIAKGLRIVGVHAMEEVQIRAAMMQFANDNPGVYMEKVQSTVNHIEGLILDGIDKRIFVLDTTPNSHRWKWAMGPKTDQLIVELSINTPNVNQALITHVQQTPGVVNDFLPALMETRKLMSAESNMKKELAGVDVLAMMRDGKRQETQQRSGLENFDVSTAVKEVLSNQEDSVFDFGDGTTIDINLNTITKLPTDYKSAQEFLGVHIGKKTPALAKRLNEEIQRGDITLDNIEDALEGFKLEVNQ